jgi:membrane fusion protein
LNQPAPKPPPRQLFRQEALDAQREKLLGEVSRARPLPGWVFTLLAGSVAGALIAFAFLGEYTRRERVEGYLEAEAGAARITTPMGGVVAELLVKEGEEVGQGQAIARLTQERTNRAGTSAAEEVKRELTGRMGRLDEERQQAELLGEQQYAQARKRADDLRKELAQAEAEVASQRQRLASARAAAARYEGLVKEGFASEAMARERANDVLDQTTRLESLKRNHSSLERELRAAQSELPLIQIRAKSQQQQLEQQRSELQQSLVQEESRAENVVRAPVAGTVTNIAATQGDSLAPDAALATLMPRGSGLRAQLLVPTRAIGFIAPGNPVVMRYDAFPFQRFGQYRGTVVSVGRTVWSAGERVGPVAVREPAYRIEVRLENQTVHAGAQELTLRPGMLLSADILLEKRTIFEWVFEPVLNLRERLR